MEYEAEKNYGEATMEAVENFDGFNWNNLNERDDYIKLAKNYISFPEGLKQFINKSMVRFAGFQRVNCMHLLKSTAGKEGWICISRRLATGCPQMKRKREVHKGAQIAVLAKICTNCALHLTLR